MIADIAKELGGEIDRLEKIIALHRRREQLAAEVKALNGYANQLANKVRSAVAKEFNIPKDSLLYRGQQTRRIAIPRMVAMMITLEIGRRESRLSAADVGYVFGGIDHSMISYACRSIGDTCDVDPEFRARVDRVRKHAGGIKSDT